MAKAKCNGRWIDTLIAAQGKFIVLETGDGVIREGKISGYTTKSFMLNGEVVEVPEEVELNGDPQDRVPLDRCAKIKIS